MGGVGYVNRDISKCNAKQLLKNNEFYGLFIWKGAPEVGGKKIRFQKTT